MPLCEGHVGSGWVHGITPRMLVDLPWKREKALARDESCHVHDGVSSRQLRSLRLSEILPGSLSPPWAYLVVYLGRANIFP